MSDGVLEGREDQPTLSTTVARGAGSFGALGPPPPFSSGHYRGLRTARRSRLLQKGDGATMTPSGSCQSFRTPSDVRRPGSGDSGHKAVKCYAVENLSVVVATVARDAADSLMTEAVITSSGSHACSIHSSGDVAGGRQHEGSPGKPVLGRGGVAASQPHPPASHLGDLGWIPGGLTPGLSRRGYRTGRCHLQAGFLGVLPLPPPLHSSVALMSCPGMTGSYGSQLESPASRYAFSATVDQQHGCTQRGLRNVVIPATKCFNDFNQQLRDTCPLLARKTARTPALEDVLEAVSNAQSTIKLTPIPYPRFKPKSSRTPDRGAHQPTAPWEVGTSSCCCPIADNVVRQNEDEVEHLI
ncbi:hypothetical protein PR048_029065 [Dryococelus australis]|uniref:Uncharacterized protein n=1 Tax=Dryococelus australis TaxID=614101 RepID=A0ABQ9GCB0_9NEOP|nr:hypothetical protein PR048_029065 [Dryococelus australis]